MITQPLKSLSICLSLLAATTVCPTASFASDLAPGAISILEKAAARDAGAHLATATVLAIDANPEAALIILKKAITLAPAREAEIRAAVAAANPGNPKLTTPVAQQQAQAKIDAAPKSTTKTKPAGWGFTSIGGWNGSVELNASRNTGNTAEKSLGLIADLNKEQEKWTHHFSGLADFQESNGNTTKQRFLAAYQLDYKFNGRLYSFGSIQYEDDRFGGFDYRITENAGLGYIVLDGDNLHWILEAGPGARHTKPIAGGSFETEFVALGQSKFSWIISESALFEHNFQVFTGTDSTTFDTTASIKMKINGSLSGRLSYNVRYNSDVPVATRKTDTVTRAGLVYDF